MPKFCEKLHKNDKLTDLFHEKNQTNSINLRNAEKYEVFSANTDRMRKSSVIYMQNLLNSDHKEKMHKSTTQI